MKREPFMPDGDNDLAAWHDNLKTKALADAAVFGLTAGDTTMLTTDNTDFHAKLTANVTAKDAAKASTNAKNISRVLLEAHARPIIRKVKAHSAYNPTYGASWGIIGAEDSTNLSTSAPILNGVPRPGGRAELTFVKSTSDGVNIYCRRGGETEWTFLARDTESPYVDTRPLLVPGKPELREYRAIFVVGDEEVGNASAEIVVNCAP